MAVHRPLIIKDNKHIQEMTTGQVLDMHRRIAYLYVQNPTVTVSRVSSGGNISPNMVDERYRSGTAKRNTSGVWPAVTSFPTEAQTGEPVKLSFTYDRISTATSSHATNPSYTLKPVRVDGSNGVREMSFSDMIDTFIDPVVDYIETGTSATQSAGAYFISTSSSISNCTNLGVVYTDTKANVSGYLASNIGTANTTQDVFTSTNYNLFRNNGSNVQNRTPLIIDGERGLRHMTWTEFDNFFQPLIQHYIYGETGYTLRYNVDGNGTTKGSVMVNNVLNGVTGNFTTYKATLDDYRAQEFPNGTNSTPHSYRLKVERT